MSEDHDRDPVEKHSEDGTDLYDISTWEERTALDRVSVWIYNFFIYSIWLMVGAVVLGILVIELLIVGMSVREQPEVAVLMVLSILPALGIAAYVWKSDVTKKEPVKLLSTTFILSAAFALIGGFISLLGAPLIEIPAIGLALFFFLAVAPAEEFVKWFSIRIYAYRSRHFNAVIDGAVYGAIAGLGFATVENMLYINQGFPESLKGQTGTGALRTTYKTTTLRALAGPGHVIYSAFAGYYLGLAKFNREKAGPIIIKGLLVASLIHATYNTLVSYLPPLFGIESGDSLTGIAVIGVGIIIFDGIFGYFLLRKIWRYKSAHNNVVPWEAQTEPRTLVDESATGNPKMERSRRDPTENNRYIKTETSLQENPDRISGEGNELSEDNSDSGEGNELSEDNSDGNHKTD